MNAILIQTAKTAVPPWVYPLVTDGKPHRVCYYTPSYSHALNPGLQRDSKHETVDFGDDSCDRDCTEDITNNADEEIKELDVPDIVHEVVSAIQSMLFVPSKFSQTFTDFNV